MQHLAQEALDKYHASRTTIDLDYAAIACSLYYKVAGNNIFSISDQNQLNRQLSRVTIWGQEYLSLFANSTAVISPKIIYEISSQVIANISFIEKAGESTFHFAVATLLEAAIGLLVKGQDKFADGLLKQINHLTLPDREMLLIVGRNFLNAVLTCRRDKHDDQATQIIHFLTSMNMTTTAAYFLEILNKVKAID